MLLKPCTIYNTRQYKYMKPFTQYTYITFKFDMNSLGVLVYVHFCEIYTWCLLFYSHNQIFCHKMLILASPSIIYRVYQIFICRYKNRSNKKWIIYRMRKHTGFLGQYKFK